MDLVAIVAVVCAAWVALALVATALCRSAARVDAEIDLLGAELLRAHERGQGHWRPAAL